MANATPHNTAGSQDPAAIPKSAQPRHFVSLILPRHSIDTARRIMPNRIASSGRYSVENTVAYHPGNAANIAAPPTISQTSLPSQTGPMVLSTVRRRISRSPMPMRANGSINMPTPKSKPSRMKKPRNSMPMMPNHNSCSPTGQLLSSPCGGSQALVRKRKRRHLVIAGRARRCRFRVVFLWPFDDVALEQPEPDDGQHRVNKGERHQ